MLKCKWNKLVEWQSFYCQFCFRLLIFRKFKSYVFVLEKFFSLRAWWNFWYETASATWCKNESTKTENNSCWFFTFSLWRFSKVKMFFWLCSFQSSSWLLLCTFPSPQLKTQQWKHQVLFSFEQDFLAKRHVICEWAEVPRFWNRWFAQFVDILNWSSFSTFDLLIFI